MTLKGVWPGAGAGEIAKSRTGNADVQRIAEMTPNGVRLSCAAVLCFSQTQLYHNRRRQLQPRVRQRTTRYGRWYRNMVPPEPIPPP
jgi:hypothetical protein